MNRTMRGSFHFAAAAAGMLLAAGCASTPKDPRPGPSAAMGIERAAGVSDTPVAMRGGKLFIDATVAGEKSEFIFDTGTPTMIAKSLADRLGLKVTGQNTGRDAHGRTVKMAKTMVPELKLGGLTFRQVPALIFDFGALELGRCFFQGGVIGSEVLKGSAWRLSHDRLLAADTVQRLPKHGPKALSTQLVSGGYPYPPIVKARFGAIDVFALFDTGNREELALAEQVVQSAKVTDERKGFGSAGVSAGGRAADRPLRRMTVTNVGFGKVALGPLRAITRANPPTLLGAGLLTRFDVILDYVGGKFTLDPRSNPAPRPRSAGYGIAIVEGRGKVTQLFDDSAAARAGLKLGDRVVAVNGKALTFSADSAAYGSPKCAAARWLAWEFDPTQPARVTVRRGGKDVEVVVGP